jgi:NTE family protein
MAYHAGVLKALEDEGFDLPASDIVVGTSAGSIIASYMAAGWTPSDFHEHAHGRHRDAMAEPRPQREEARGLFVPLYESGLQSVARGIGSTFAALSSRGLLNGLFGGRKPAGFLRRAFPSGMFSTDATKARFARDLPEDWPREGLYICAADLYSGKRVAFGMPGAPPASLRDAVLASTAIPGIFPPVRIGDRHYVDGGIYSATSLDLAAEAGCDAILCIAPLGYRAEARQDPIDPRTWSPMLVRSLFVRSLRREVRDARARGIDVLVVRPTVEELKEHGTNSMRRIDRASIADAAVASTKRLLARHDSHPVMQAFTSGGARREEKAGSC